MKHGLLFCQVAWKTFVGVLVFATYPCCEYFSDLVAIFQKQPAEGPWKWREGCFLRKKETTRWLAGSQKIWQCGCIFWLILVNFFCWFCLVFVFLILKLKVSGPMNFPTLRIWSKKISIKVDGHIQTDVWQPPWATTDSICKKRTLSQKSPPP